MFIPYHVDVPQERRPIVNWMLILLNVLIFSITFKVMGAEIFPYENMVADGWRPSGLFGHMFLHANIGHIFGNMLFLWLFGNAVCAKVSNRLYLPIYFVVGLASVAFFNLISGGRLIGASGAINGIVGMYLVFFPLNDIDCFYMILFRPHCFTVSSYWMILLWLFFDIMGLMLFDNSMVAYSAHVGGFFTGVGIGLLMLKYKLVEMERYECSLVDVIKHRGRPVKKSQLEPELQALLDKRTGVLCRESEAEYAYSQEEVVEKKTAREKLKEKTSEAAISVKDGKINFYCDCGKKVKVPVSYSGRQGKCPGCGEVIDVPKLKV